MTSLLMWHFSHVKAVKFHPGSYCQFHGKVKLSFKKTGNFVVVSISKTSGLCCMLSVVVRQVLVDDVSIVACFCIGFNILDYVEQIFSRLRNVLISHSSRRTNIFCG